MPIMGNVSIPRSGFCSFKLLLPPREHGREKKFQSLGRDSVHSSLMPIMGNKLPVVVSIPRSGFCSFKQQLAAMEEVTLSKFQSLGRDSVHSSVVEIEAWT